MHGYTLGIAILSMMALTVLANGSSSTNENDKELEIDGTSSGGPQDEFEKAVMERIRPELKPRMQSFFKLEPGKLTDAEVRELYQTTFNLEEQKELEEIFGQVVEEQMKRIMGQMDGFKSEMDRLGDIEGPTPNFDDWNELDNDHDHDDDLDFDFDVSEEDGNDSTPWNDKKKFVLEPAESTEDDLQEKGSHKEDGEDKLMKDPAKDEL